MAVMGFLLLLECLCLDHNARLNGRVRMPALV